MTSYPNGIDPGDLRFVAPATSAFDPDPHYEAWDRRRVVERALAALPARRRQVLTLRFGFDGPSLTLAEVGWLLRVTTERVRQIQRKALYELQRCAKATGLADYRPEGSRG